MFPEINHISEVLAAIKGRTLQDGGEFAVNTANGVTVIDYVFVQPDTFQDPATARDPAEAHMLRLRRECRGIIFCAETGVVVSRGYHKFFNIGQNAETQPALIDLTGPHVLLEKLDGSMVRTYRTLDGRTRFGTRAGETEVSAQAERFAVGKPGFVIWDGVQKGKETLARLIQKEGKLSELIAMLPAAYEWCGRANRVVVGYPEDQMVLTGIRGNRSGDYMPYAKLLRVAAVFGVPVVRALNIGGLDVKTLLEYMAAEEGMEGCVVRRDSGEMYKVKTAWYMNLHHSVFALQHEKDTLRLVFADQTDDLVPMLPPEIAAQLETYVAAVTAGLDASVARPPDVRGQPALLRGMDPGPEVAPLDGKHGLHGVGGQAPDAVVARDHRGKVAQ